MCSCCGNLPRKTNSVSARSPATISRTLLPPWSRPLRCWRFSTRRTISAVPAAPRAASRRPRPRSCSRRCWRSRKSASSSCRSMPGPPNWWPAIARSRYASSFTASCSSRTRTAPNTRRWCRPRAMPDWPRWSCCSAPAPSIRPTSSTGSASCSNSSRAAPNSRRCSRCRSMTANCRWPRCRPTRLTIPALPKSTMPCQSPAWAVAGSRWACTLPPPAWRCSPAMPSTRWRASASPLSTCPATRSPCCRPMWSNTTRWVPASRARRCPSTPPSTKRRWSCRTRAARSSACRSRTTCAWMCWTLSSHRSGWTTRPPAAISPNCRRCARNWCSSGSWRSSSRHAAK